MAQGNVARRIASLFDNNNNNNNGVNHKRDKSRGFEMEQTVIPASSEELIETKRMILEFECWASNKKHLLCQLKTDEIQKQYNEYCLKSKRDDLIKPEDEYIKQGSGRLNAAFSARRVHNYLREHIILRQNGAPADYSLNKLPQDKDEIISQLKNENIQLKKELRYYEEQKQQQQQQQQQHAHQRNFHNNHNHNNNNNNTNCNRCNQCGNNGGFNQSTNCGGNTCNNGNGSNHSHAGNSQGNCQSNHNHNHNHSCNQNQNNQQRNNSSCAWGCNNGN